jgi:hypothetical protein
LQAIKQELENPPRVADMGSGPADSIKELDTTVKELSASFRDLNNQVAPVVAFFAAFAVLSRVIPLVIALSGAIVAFTAALTGGGGLTAALGIIVAALGGPVTLAIVGISAAVAVMTAAWIGNWGDIQGKTQAFTAWLTGTAQPAIAAFFTWLQRDAMLRFAFEWQTFWAERVVDVQKALIAFLKAAQDGWKAFTDWWDGGSPLFEALWRTFWNTTIPAPFKALWTGLTGTAMPGWEQFIGWLTGALAAFVKLWTDTWEKLPKPNIPWPFGQGPGGGTGFTSFSGGAGSGRFGDLSGGGRVPVETVSQFNTGLLTASEAQAACGPAAYAWFMANYGRNPNLRESVELAKEFGWNEGRGMAGAGSFQAMLRSQGLDAQMINTSEIDAALASGQPVVVSTAGHYFQVAGGTARGGYNVGASGTAYAGGSPIMTLAQMEALTGAINGIIAGPPSQAAMMEGIGEIAAAAIRAGIDPRVIQALAEHETGNFQSELYKQAHNIFSLKGTGPAGSVTMPAWEVVNGQNVTSNETFRKYNTDAEAIEDFFNLISTSTRYAEAWLNRADPTAFMQGLQRGGYATDPNWSTNVLKKAYGGTRDPRMISDLMLGDLEKALAESFHIRPDIFDSMGAQVANFAQLMTENLDPAAISAKDALMRLSNAMAPVENAVANTVMPLGDLERTLVEMVARAGFGDEAFNEMNDGAITSFTALKQTAAMLASIDPRFQALLDNLDATGSSSADFALDLMNLLKTLNSPAAQEALTPPAEGVAPSVKAPPTVVIDPNVTKNLDAAKAGVVAVSTTTIEQNRVMAENWKTVGLAIDEARDRLRVYTDYLFELSPQRLQEQTGGWTEIRDMALDAAEAVRRYNAALEDLEPPPKGEDIPEAHTGARVMTGGVAELEAGEVVLTPEQQERYGIGGGGPVYHITNNLTVNPRPGDEYRVYENFRVMSALWGAS